MHDYAARPPEMLTSSLLSLQVEAMNEYKPSIVCAGLSRLRRHSTAPCFSCFRTSRLLNVFAVSQDVVIEKTAGLDIGAYAGLCIEPVLILGIAFQRILAHYRCTKDAMDTGM